MSRRQSPYRYRDRITNEIQDNPVSIFGTDLVSWHRSDLGVTVDGSNRVSNWADQTGNGHHLEQTTAGSRPDFVASGGAGGFPYIDSAAYGTAFLNYIGTPLTVNTGNWSGFIIMSAGTLTATRVMTTTLTTPAGCVFGAFRIVNATGDIDFQQLILSAPTAITITAPDMAPATTWMGAGVTMNPDGTRGLAAFGDGIVGLTGDGPHAGSIGLRLAEGYVCARFGGSFYLNLRIQELFWASRSSSTTDVNRVRNYMRSRGVST